MAQWHLQTIAKPHIARCFGWCGKSTDTYQFQPETQTNHPMYTEDYEEWRWGQILTRRADYNPDDQPPTDEDEEDAQTQE